MTKWYERYIYLADEVHAFAKLKKAGVKIVTDVDIAAFKKAVQPVWQKYEKKYPYAKAWIKTVEETPSDHLIEK